MIFINFISNIQGWEDLRMKRTISVGEGILDTAEQSVAKPKVFSRSRIENVDMLRGFVMILMALDHVRYFFSMASFNPLDISQTSFPWFMTRWITHLCAPSFVLLAGMGIGLSKKIPKTLSTFLFTRGCWLIFLEISIINIGWGTGVFLGVTTLGVLWALGVSMVFMAAGVYLNKKALLLICLALIFGHNMLDSLDASFVASIGPLWHILHKPGQIHIMDQSVMVIYPIIPWVGLMGIGYLMSNWEKLNNDQTMYLKLGVGLIGLFFILRLGGLYGDSMGWDSNQQGLTKTFLSLLNVSKYPPSLHYLLITVGIGCTLLYFLRNLKSIPALIFGTFGRAPLFFYIIHIPFIHLLAMVWQNFNYGLDWNWWHLKRNFPDEIMIPNLLTVYLAWLVTLVLLFPFTIKFEAFKSRSKAWWVSYL